MPCAHSEDAPEYGKTDGFAIRAKGKKEDSVIAQALAILSDRMRKPGRAMSSPQDVKNYLILQSAELEHEEFSVLFLDAQHCVIAFESMFRGSISQTSVYPREVLKRALALNAAAVILSHNHPSGKPEPSRADEHLTQTLKSALALADIRVLDHIVIGGVSSVSFAERGLI